MWEKPRTHGRPAELSGGPGGSLRTEVTEPGEVPPASCNPALTRTECGLPRGRLSLTRFASAKLPDPTSHAQEPRTQVLQRRPCGQTEGRESPRMRGWRGDGGGRGKGRGALEWIFTRFKNDAGICFQTFVK